MELHSLLLQVDISLTAATILVNWTFLVNFRDANKDLTPKDKDLTLKDQDKDLTPKDLLDLTPQGQEPDPQGPGQGLEICF